MPGVFDEMLRVYSGKCCGRIRRINLGNGIDETWMDRREKLPADFGKVLYSILSEHLCDMGYGTSERINDKRACVQQASFMQAVL